ncbi:MAG: tyrosine-type recombinase/integrase [Coleofasciculaceae cyanobacterium RL_1_1]|nr:tyrosine-type recombinase/integrase [Coleofasciculaceae cyanobacterium RL_1_1]
MVDKALSLYGDKDFDTFIDAVKGSYAASTQSQIFKGLRAAFNYYIKKYDKSLSNPFSSAAQESKAEIPESKRSKQAYRINEAMSIINAFATGEYATAGYEYHDMHYVRLVSFLFNTGCRIEDALALTWDCIGKDCIEFSKSYSKGIHKSTKNEKTRYFPLTDKLRDIIGDADGKKPTDLVFPAIKGGYINLNSWRRSYWSRIINALIRDGKVRKYLPPYHTRHTFISIQREDGVPDAVIAEWVESSESMIVKHYSDSQSEKYKPSVI